MESITFEELESLRREYDTDLLMLCNMLIKSGDDEEGYRVQYGRHAIEELCTKVLQFIEKKKTT